MNKKIGLLCGVILAIAILAVIFMGSSPQAEINEEMESTIKSALELEVSQADIVDDSGNYNENCLNEYRNELQKVFSDESGIAEKDSEIMENILASYDEYTDVTLGTEIVDLDIQNVEIEGDKAAISLKATCVQKYIPYDDYYDKYQVVISASKSAELCELVREEDGWKVMSIEESDYVFGTPQEMGLTQENYEKDFSTRQEACQYAATIDFNDFKS